MIELFNAENINKSYSQNGFSLNNISLELLPGKITGVVGENGNGKTTLLRIVAGDLSIDTGKIEYFGNFDPDFISWEIIKSKIAYIPQRIPKWHGFLRDNLIFAATIRNIKGKKADDLVDELVEKLGLKAYVHLKWSEISTGYRLRFELAKMLIGSPELLVLDEPIANLDINAQGKFLSDLKNLVSEPKRNVAVILSSQQLHEIENVSDNVVFLKQGKMIFSGDVDKIGETRNENEFEIQGSFDEAQLSNLFPDIKIKKTGKTYTIKIPLETSSEKFLKLLIEKEFKIAYFRDISSSTKKLFNSEN